MLGILYLCFFWTFIPTVLGVLECLLMPGRVRAYNERSDQLRLNPDLHRERKKLSDPVREARRAVLQARLDAKLKEKNFRQSDEYAKRFDEIRIQIEALRGANTFGTKKEIKCLPETLEPDETMKALTSGYMDGNTWLIVCTDRRVLFLDKGLIYGLKQTEIPLESISSVIQRKGLMVGSIQILGAGLSGMKVDNIIKEDVAKFAKAVQNARRERAEKESHS